MLRKSKRVIIPPELRREGWKGRCVDAFGVVGGRRKNQRNATARAKERMAVVILFFGFGMMKARGVGHVEEAQA
jgi:hypothetical protein